MNEDTNSNTTSTEPSDIKSQVLAFRDNAHAANVKKLKAGIKCIFTVPACFLILLFLTGSSKIIFLVLWIASLFIIAAYLIHVEYSDYKVQEMVNSLQDTEDNIDGLIDINSIYTKVAAPKKKLDDIITNVKTDIQTQITAVQDKVAERWLRLCRMIRVCLCSLMSKTRQFRQMNMATRFRRMNRMKPQKTQKLTRRNYHEKHLACIHI